jgi:hypothetical protein
MSEKPPEENDTAFSGRSPSVAPTEVTYGQAPGNVGRNRVAFLASFDWQADPGPVSPLETMTDVPIVPNLPILLHTFSAYDLGTLCSFSPYEIDIVCGMSFWLSSHWKKYWYGSLLFLVGWSTSGMNGPLPPTL